MRTHMAVEATKQRFVLHAPIQPIGEDDELSVNLLEAPKSPRIPNMNDAYEPSFTQLAVNGQQVQPVLIDDDNENLDYDHHENDHEKLHHEEEDYEEAILASLEAGRQFDPPEDIGMGERDTSANNKCKD